MFCCVTGAVSTVCGLGAAPVSIAVMSNNVTEQLFVTTSASSVWKVAMSGATGTSSWFCGVSLAGYADGHCSVAAFGTLGDVVYIAGDLIVADTSNNALRKIGVASSNCQPVTPPPLPPSA